MNNIILKTTDQHPYLGICLKSEAIDTDQSVALRAAKVTIDTDRWKIRNGNVY